jgi:hypothetical protein
MRKHNLRVIADTVGVVLAMGEEPQFHEGDKIRVLSRSPIGHYRVPRYLRGKEAIIESVIELRAIDNEEEAYGRNAGCKRHYYRIAVLMTELWPNYAGSKNDGLRIEVYESWLERR